MSAEINPIASRRHAYAQAAARDGDWSTAADVLEQTLELAPRWAAAWFALGEAREKLGAGAEAAAAFGEACASDLEDSLGARARSALLGGEPATALPLAYIARLFDQYAPRFDSHLTDALAYRAPELLAAVIDDAAPGRRFARAIDLGCGTGLAGAALRDRIDELIGVDLSERMIAEARKRAIYDRLEIGEAAAHLREAPAGRADLVIAADLLAYFGDLTPIFGEVARALAPGGLFAFTLEAMASGEGFRLGAAMRFGHAADHVAQAADRAGLRRLELTPASARREAGRDVPGWIGIAHATTASVSARPRESAG